MSHNPEGQKQQEQRLQRPHKNMEAVCDGTSVTKSLRIKFDEMYYQIMEWVGPLLYPQMIGLTMEEQS